MGKDTKGTLVIISPSENYVLRFPVSSFLGFFLLFILLASAISFYFLKGPVSQAPATIQHLNDQTQVISANLDSVTEEIRELLKVNNIFNAELEQALSTLYPLSKTMDSQPQLNTGFADTAQFFGLNSHTSRVQEDIRNLSNTFRSAAPAVIQVKETLSAQQDLLRKLPTYWPVVGGRMGLTMEYGPRIHPFTGQWYMHKGADIAGPAGTPLVAAADGVVVRSEDDRRSGYGNVVVIEHAFGFSTLYAHMRERRVVLGQKVQQGQLIGTMGRTGIATGVHLHYEIKIGEEVLDPTTYLAIRNNFYRWESLIN